MTPLFSTGKPFDNAAQKNQPNDLQAASSSIYSEAEIYCDGACSGNPGKSGIGVVILFHGSKENELRISEYIGEATNNIAEYTSLLKGLTEADSSGVKKVRVFMDSELVVKQIKGEYRVRNENLKLLWVKAMKLIDKFEKFEISHVRRELNGEADALARSAVEGSKKR
ncbi:MAG: ribonuclease HI family protein [Thermodesulfovibrionia bacterium]|nr:ribonuclease HI family protein [Thermodesulfovibrionia bacterium]